METQKKMKNRHKWSNEILAFAEGKQIQSKRPDVLDEWEDDDFPLWNDPDTKFRIKPEPEYTPFTFDDREELRGKWVRRKSSGNECLIYHLSEAHVNTYSWEESIEEFEFLDGTPFGKPVEDGGEE